MTLVLVVDPNCPSCKGKGRYTYRELDRAHLRVGDRSPVVTRERICPCVRTESLESLIAAVLASRDDKSAT